MAIRFQKHYLKYREAEGDSKLGALPPSPLSLALWRPTPVSCQRALKTGSSALLVNSVVAGQR